MNSGDVKTTVVAMARAPSHHQPNIACKPQLTRSSLAVVRAMDVLHDFHFHMQIVASGELHTGQNYANSAVDLE